MTKTGKKGIARLINACLYSMAGLKAAWKNEQAFRQEIYLSILVIPLAFLLGENQTKRCLLILAWLIVPLIELINSAIEAVVDRFGDEYHELSGRAKDLGSAAVLLSIFIALVIWGLVAFERFFS
jgi:diacylglycerol kinase (ATP)